MAPAADVTMDNRIVAVAARLGRFAATVNRPVTSCPYLGDDDDTAALRRVWLVNYLRVRPPAAGTVSYDGDVDASEAATLALPGSRVHLVEAGAIIDDDPVDDSPFTDEEFALLVALDELDGRPLVEVFDASQARYPKGHPKGGQWRSMADRVKQSIEDHRAGKHGDKHPLEGYSREQLRKVAKARGIELARGEDRDSIAGKLIGHFGDDKAKPQEKPKAEPKPAKAPKAPKAPAAKPAPADTPPAKKTREPNQFAAPFHRNLDGIEDLAQAVEDGYPPKNVRPLTGGASAETELVTLAGGRQVVHKVGGNPDAEQASAMLAEAIGAPAPRVYRDSSGSVYMDYVDADSAAVSRLRAATPDGSGSREWDDRADGFPSSPSGRLVGLLDMMTANGDRNDGNWLIAPDGSIVAIDHGHTFPSAVIGVPGRRVRPYPVLTRFSAQYVGRGRELTANGFTVDELSSMRARAEARRPDFAHIGRERWLDYAVAVLDALGAAAAGSEKAA